MDKYSVLMSVYMKETPDNLDAAVRSIVRQTLTPDEIIIVKDGPITDELQTVLDRYSDAYPDLVRVVGYAENKGLGIALNFGLQHCRNELIARMDTDDISTPDRCMKEVCRFAADPDLDAVSCNNYMFSDSADNVLYEEKFPESNGEIAKAMKIRCPISHSASMFKKSSVVSAGGYRDLFYNEDYFLWIRMLKNGAKFYNIQESLLYVRKSELQEKRRGGWKYFKSNEFLFRYMLKNHIISIFTYLFNVCSRFVLQVLTPSSLRSRFRKIIVKNSNKK